MRSSRKKILRSGVRKVCRKSTRTAENKVQSNDVALGQLQLRKKRSDFQLRARPNAAIMRRIRRVPRIYPLYRSQSLRKILSRTVGVFSELGKAAQNIEKRNSRQRHLRIKQGKTCFFYFERKKFPHGIIFYLTLP